MISGTKNDPPSFMPRTSTSLLSTALWTSSSASVGEIDHSSLNRRAASCRSNPIRRARHVKTPPVSTKRHRPLHGYRNSDRSFTCATELPLDPASPCEDWSLTSLKEKLIKIGAKIVSHGRYVAFQMAEVAIPRKVFADILRLIAELRPPVTSTA